MADQAARDRFLAEELKDWAPLLQERMRDQLNRRGINVTGELMRSLMSRLIGSKEVQLEFLQRGRWNDMGARKGWRKGVYIGQGQPGPRPKGTKFYSRTKMGLYGQLVSNLSNKYVEALYQQAKEVMSDGGKD